jgi:copper ion binding protein
MTTAKLAIRGMTCEHCVKRVTKALAEVAGVLQAEVSLAENSAQVTFDEGKTSLAALTQAVEEAGYEASAA